MTATTAHCAVSGPVTDHPVTEVPQVQLCLPEVAGRR